MYQKVVKDNKPIKYPGYKTVEEVEDVYLYDIWDEWARETGYEFTNCGTECCPEYNYPTCDLFYFE